MYVSLVSQLNPVSLFAKIPKMGIMEIAAFNYNRQANELWVLDQRKLPASSERVSVRNSQDGFRVIKDMLVRGAPCIAAVGCLSLVVHMNSIKRTELLDATIDTLVAWFDQQSEFLIQARPTAVNLQSALRKLKQKLIESRARAKSSCDLINELTEICDSALNKGIDANKRLAAYGVNEFSLLATQRGLNILTHCNTGSLATVGYGTALGVIRSLHEQGRLNRVFCTETRPYNQGSRLTAWELEKESIPTTLIADNMVAYLMTTRLIDGVIVGADRVTANGDTANKIGTLQIAVTAKQYKVPFYVAAPSQSVDLNTPNANGIVVEQRPASELRFFGSPTIQIAPETVDVWNPCFDITTSDLIKGIITEYGVCKPLELDAFLKAKVAESEVDALY